MKKFFPVICLLLFHPHLFAQSTEDVIYFKNGSVLHGQVLEQWPGISIKVRINDGTVKVYRTSDVAKIAQFDLPPQNQGTGTAMPPLPSSSSPNSAFNLPSRAGQVGFGLMAGGNLTNESYYGSQLDPLFGFAGGCFVDFGLSDVISIEPELYFSMKGAAQQPDYSEHLNYLELTPLFKLNFPGGPDLRFDLFTGPSIAVLLAAYATYQGTTYPESSFFNQGDAGWLFGGGLEIGRFLLNLRYETGFVPLYSGTGYGGPVNTSFSLMAGYRLFN